MWLLSNCNPQVDFAEIRVQQQVMIPVVEKIAKSEDTPAQPDDDFPG
jgi:hypothetical protein